MKKPIDVFDYAGDICKAMKKGILLTTRRGEEVNTMTIGWGMVGIEWNKPIFITYVRQNRHTRTLLDDAKEFTVNIPVGDIDPNILAYCGRNSGRDVNKIQDMNLTLEEPNVIQTPGIRQLPFTLECKVLYRQDQDLNLLPTEIVERLYPQNIDGCAAGKNRDFHVAYYAEIVDAYIIE